MEVSEGGRRGQGQAEEGRMEESAHLIPDGERGVQGAQRRSAGHFK